MAALNTLLLLFVFWIEAPEEVFFRGYVQNHLQERIGPNMALFVGAIIWTCWHLFALADFIHILLFGLAFSLVFRLRQNTTPLAVWHPLGNRLLVLFLIASPLLGKG
jgi:membrane protease YdiL (CAAX protease family)